MVSLREELDNLKHYFTLQKIRYGDCFEVVYKVDETALDHKVPRFILQPLAENAVLHGSEGGGRKIVITVKCICILGGVLLEIADNGAGFEQTRPRGIGISNVDERLRLHYGRSHKLNVKSAVGKGTVCRVLVPVV
jgi:two-component system sensor histidine kinase YesM